MQAVAIAIADERQLEYRSTEQKQGYNTGFAAVFEKYYTRVFAFVYSRVRDADLAKDLVSEVFEKAYVKGSNVRDPGAYTAWLFMIAKNAIAGYYRKQRREFAYESKVRDEMHCAGEPPHPEDFVMRDERISHLMRLVKLLPARDQEMISLKFDAELSHAEIGRIMGITPLNVRVSIFRAMKRMRAMMAEDGLI